MAGADHGGEPPPLLAGLIAGCRNTYTSPQERGAVVGIIVAEGFALSSRNRCTCHVVQVNTDRRCELEMDHREIASCLILAGARIEREETDGRCPKSATRQGRSQLRQIWSDNTHRTYLGRRRLVLAAAEPAATGAGVRVRRRSRGSTPFRTSKRQITALARACAKLTSLNEPRPICRDLPFRRYKNSHDRPPGVT
jgi:hypothetical protein